LKWVLGVGAAVFALMALSQAWNLVHAAWTLHPAAGVATAAVLLAAVGYFIGRPIAAYLTRPKVAEPPALPEGRAPTPGELRRVTKYMAHALDAAERNPELAETRGLLPAARRELAAWDAKLASASADQGAALEKELAAWADRTMDPIWKPVDAKVEQAIHAEAVNVGIATAVSPNGTLDAYVMLWRATHLVGRIAELHYGRPGLVGSLHVCRDVAVATAVAGYLQSFTESLGNLAMRTIGGVAGMMAGPVAEGVTNALVMTRIGQLARVRCRSYRQWTPLQQKHALVAAFSATQKAAMGITAEILRRTGTGLGAVAGAAASSVANVAEATREKLEDFAHSAGEVIAGFRNKLFGGPAAERT
jgi:putative membrane protein